ncbi:MAG: GNAT family N-acetyltransferase, partial [Myxococcales bacterium]|nr:GNAT family N-acetyltransferase [Myxococcales bacterium]
MTGVVVRPVSELGIAACHAAFTRGFADYAVPLDLSLEQFEQRFFGVECNAPERSHVALVDGAPVGVILGGARPFAGAPTLRMGAMAIAPEHRGRLGISDALFERHLASARAAGCSQLWLEVIEGNARALAFYRRRGYSEFGRLRYYQRAGAHDDARALERASSAAPRFA